MRCFIDAIGKLLFCLLVSTGSSDLLFCSLPGSGQVSVLLLVDSSAGSEVYRLKGFSKQATHLIPSMKNGESNTLNCLLTNVVLCFLSAVRGPDDRPRGCRVWQRAGLTTCCPTAVWCMLGSCPLQVTTQASPCIYIEARSHRHTDILNCWGESILTSCKYSVNRAA